MKVLQLTVHFSPNIGGVETHLNDLIQVLAKKGWKVIVLAYQPLSTQVSWKIHEKSGNLTILRIPWVRGFFEKLVAYPFVEFLYLFPGLFIVTPFVIIRAKPDVIHAHGLIATTVAVIWKKVFGIKVISSTHSIYHFPKFGLYYKMVLLIFKSCNRILCLSEKSKNEIVTLGINVEKVSVFTYWVDLIRFNMVLNAKKRLGWEKEFVVLFVGRLIAEKGINELLLSVKYWNKGVVLAIAGSGLMEKEVVAASERHLAIRYLGKVDQASLPLYYSGSDLVVVPSVHEEGFGRVIIESLACGTPVIAADRGAISEAMDNSVGWRINITPKTIAHFVNYLYSNPDKVKSISANCRKYALMRYSEKNSDRIIKFYEKTRI